MTDKDRIGHYHAEQMRNAALKLADDGAPDEATRALIFQTVNILADVCGIEAVEEPKTYGKRGPYQKRQNKYHTGSKYRYRTV